MGKQSLNRKNNGHLKFIYYASIFMTGACLIGFNSLLSSMKENLIFSQRMIQSTKEILYQEIEKEEIQTLESVIRLQERMLNEDKKKYYHYLLILGFFIISLMIVNITIFAYSWKSWLLGKHNSEIIK
ncbi:hypothetical protein PVA45_05890 [Entomospira entomophila]|uniref:Uncharacterized protein n=1 Tax=Entomospira entomophila TaxID=2719988 RepID=A0A968GEL4_9SPIO|nr:hypothetical protein [Entomospira entomophilus]NIZ41029.1 hypothetical protein [Entomospira entomophilus]WDI35241.1 hypothetical protein PVA45_05890 [Entomospira entomophilus]